MSVGKNSNDFLLALLALQQDGKQAISAPTNWIREPLLEVSTEIDRVIEQLYTSLLQDGGKNTTARWHFFIGSPGNGKSAAIGKLCRFLKKNHSCHILDENNISIEGLDETAVPYALSIYEDGNSYTTAMIIQDASVVRNPFAPDVDPASELIETVKEAWEKGVSLVVCTNRGVLEKAYREHYLDPEFNNNPWFKIIKGFVEDVDVTIEDTLGKHWDFDNPKKTFSSVIASHSFLDNRSLLMRGNDFHVFDLLVQKATHSSQWNICSNCEQISLCPFKANRDWLADEDARAKFLNILRRAEVLSGQIIVFREALAFLSFLLAGCPRDYGSIHPCHWVREKIQVNDIFALAMRRIYVGVFSSFSPYGLEGEKRLQKQQQEALKRLNELAKENGLEENKYLDHVVNGSPPTIDVGVKRLTGPQGLLAEIDPWRECLAQEFFDKWDGDFSVMSQYEHPFFTELEKRCIITWSQLEELIESIPSHEASRCYWALRRWSSTFLMHFGGLIEGLTSWNKELDEYIMVLETIVKDMNQRTTEEKLRIRDLNNELGKLLSTGENEQLGQDTIPLSETVTLSGYWVAENLRPQIDDSKKLGKNLSIPVKFQGGETATLGARAFIWLKKHSSDKLNTMCFPMELLTGIVDARIRASAKGKNAYAFADTDVILNIDTGEGEIFKLTRIFGDVDVKQYK